MENSEIFASQFDPTKALHSLIQGRAKVGKLFPQKIVDLAFLGQTKHQLIISAIMYFNSSNLSKIKECLC